MSPTEAELDSWIAASWHEHTRPQYSREYFREMWHDEQVSRAEARERDWRTKQLDDLSRRVAKLERVLGAGGQTMINGIAKATGTAIRRIRQQDRERVLAEIEARGYLTHRGVWSSDQAYPAGAVVTDHGSVWCAVVRCEAGERPSKAPGWRLMAKGDVIKARVVAW